MEIFWKKFRKLQGKGTLNPYKGSSTCRICGNTKNGSSELEVTLKGYRLRIPSGYAHYIEKHNVKPHRFLLLQFGIF